MEPKLLLPYPDPFDLKEVLELLIVKLVRRAAAHLFDARNATPGNPASNQILLLRAGGNSCSTELYIHAPFRTANSF